jgi:predicted ATP-dependent serine protease
MRSLARSIRRPDKGGEPLPTVYETLTRGGVLLRRGEVTMVAAPPGAGKSSLGLDIASKIKRPTLYFSADSTELTMATRIGATLTGRFMFDVEQQILRDPEWAGGLLKQVDHIRWSFDSAPTFEDIGLDVEAFEEVWGEPPHLIVVDNLTDVADDNGGDEFSTLRSTMKGMKYLARTSNAAVLVLHHTSEAIEGHPCPPRRAVHGKVNQMPAMILTIGNPQNGFMPIACVKNRQGPADITGETAFWLTYDPSVMHLADPER